MSLLYDCLKNLDKKVNKVHLLSTIMNDGQIKGIQQLNKVNAVIKFIDKKSEKFGVNRRKKEQEIAELKRTVDGLNVSLDKRDWALDCQEQYSRRNCLLICSIGKKNQENIDEVVINIL